MREKEGERGEVLYINQYLTFKNNHKITNTNKIYSNMKLKIDRTNKNWCKSISDEDIYNREFSIGYLINSNLDIELFKLLDDLVLSTYIVIIYSIYIGYCSVLCYIIYYILYIHCNKTKVIICHIL